MQINWQVPSLPRMKLQRRYVGMRAIHENAGVVHGVHERSFWIGLGLGWALPGLHSLIFFRRGYDFQGELRIALLDSRQLRLEHIHFPLTLGNFLFRSLPIHSALFAH